MNCYSQAKSLDIEYSSVKKYELHKGRHLVNFNLNNGNYIDISLSIPEIILEKKVPLIIALHWAGGLNTYKTYSECLAFPALEFMNAIVVAPSDHGLHWVDKQNEKKLIKLIDSIIKHWPIDPSKIIITGYSNGGIASWFYAEKYSKIFRAAIPMSGTYDAAKIEIPLYVIHGKKDELFNFYKVQNTISQSIVKGSKIQLTLIEDYSHFMGCYYTEALHKIAQQLEKEIFKN